MFQLIMRFYDCDEGEVRIDGVDVRTADPKDLRARIAPVPQDVSIFGATVAENSGQERLVPPIGSRRTRPWSGRSCRRSSPCTDLHPSPRPAQCDPRRRCTWQAPPIDSRILDIVVSLQWCGHSKPLCVKRRPSLDAGQSGIIISMDTGLRASSRFSAEAFATGSSAYQIFNLRGLNWFRVQRKRRL